MGFDEEQFIDEEVVDEEGDDKEEHEDGEQASEALVDLQKEQEELSTSVETSLALDEILIEDLDGEIYDFEDYLENLTDEVPTFDRDDITVSWPVESDGFNEDALHTLLKISEEECNRLISEEEKIFILNNLAGMWGEYQVIQQLFGLPVIGSLSLQQIMRYMKQKRQVFSVVQTLLRSDAFFQGSYSLENICVSDRQAADVFYVLLSQGGSGLIFHDWKPSCAMVRYLQERYEHDSDPSTNPLAEIYEAYFINKVDSLLDYSLGSPLLDKKYIVLGEQPPFVFPKSDEKYDNDIVYLLGETPLGKKLVGTSHTYYLYQKASPAFDAMGDTTTVLNLLQADKTNVEDHDAMMLTNTVANEFSLLEEHYDTTTFDGVRQWNVTIASLGNNILELDTRAQQEDPATGLFSPKERDELSSECDAFVNEIGDFYGLQEVKDSLQTVTRITMLQDAHENGNSLSAESRGYDQDQTYGYTMMGEDGLPVWRYTYDTDAIGGPDVVRLSPEAYERSQQIKRTHQARLYRLWKEYLSPHAANILDIVKQHEPVMKLIRDKHLVASSVLNGGKLQDAIAISDLGVLKGLTGIDLQKYLGNELFVSYTTEDDTHLGQITKNYAQQTVDGMKGAFPDKMTPERYKSFYPGLNEEQREVILRDRPRVLYLGSTITKVPIVLDFSKYPDGEVVVDQLSTGERIIKSWNEGEGVEFLIEVASIIGGILLSQLKMFKALGALGKGLIFVGGQKGSKFLITGVKNTITDGPQWSDRSYAAGETMNIYKVDFDGNFIIDEETGEREKKSGARVGIETTTEWLMASVLFTRSWRNGQQWVDKKLLGGIESKFWHTASSIGAEAAAFSVMGSVISNPLQEGISTMLESGDVNAGLDQWIHAMSLNANAEYWKENFFGNAVMVSALRGHGRLEQARKNRKNRKLREKEKEIIEEIDAEQLELQNAMQKEGVTFETVMVDGKPKDIYRNSEGEVIENWSKNEALQDIGNRIEKLSKSYERINGLRQAMLSNMGLLVDHPYHDFLKESGLSSPFKSPETIINKKIKLWTSRAEKRTGEKKKEAETELAKWEAIKEAHAKQKRQYENAQKNQGDFFIDFKYDEKYGGTEFADKPGFVTKEGVLIINGRLRGEMSSTQKRQFLAHERMHWTLLRLPEGDILPIIESFVADPAWPEMRKTIPGHEKMSDAQVVNELIADYAARKIAGEQGAYDSFLEAILFGKLWFEENEQRVALNREKLVVRNSELFGDAAYFGDILKVVKMYKDGQKTRDELIEQLTGKEAKKKVLEQKEQEIKDKEKDWEQKETDKEIIEKEIGIIDAKIAKEQAEVATLGASKLAAKDKANEKLEKREKKSLRLEKEQKLLEELMIFEGQASLDASVRTKAEISKIKKYKKQREKIEEIEGKISDLEGEIAVKNSRESKNKERRDEIDKLNAEKQKIIDEIIDLKEKANNRVKEYRTQRDTLQKEFENYDDAAMKAETDASNINLNIKQLELTKLKKQKDLATSEREQREIQDKIDKLELEVVELKAEINVKKNLMWYLKAINGLHKNPIRVPGINGAPGRTLKGQFRVLLGDIFRHFFRSKGALTRFSTLAIGDTLYDNWAGDNITDGGNFMSEVDWLWMSDLRWQVYAMVPRLLHLLAIIFNGGKTRSDAFIDAPFTELFYAWKKNWNPWSEREMSAGMKENATQAQAQLQKYRSKPFNKYTTKPAINALDLLIPGDLMEKVEQLVNDPWIVDEEEKEESQSYEEPETPGKKLLVINSYKNNSEALATIPRDRVEIEPKGGYRWPLPYAYRRLSSRMGPRGDFDTKKGKNSNNHQALDIPGELGKTPILAAKPGIVIKIGQQTNSDTSRAIDSVYERLQDKTGVDVHAKIMQAEERVKSKSKLLDKLPTLDHSEGGGKRVWVLHEDGTATLYAHMASFSVELGQKVVAGQELGKVGNTGTSSGAHLHRGIVNEEGEYIDPIEKFNFWLHEKEYEMEDTEVVYAENDQPTTSVPEKKIPQGGKGKGAEKKEVKKEKKEVKKEVKNTKSKTAPPKGF